MTVSTQEALGNTHTEAARALASQTIANDEVLVIEDDGSTSMEVGSTGVINLKYADSTIKTLANTDDIARIDAELAVVVANDEWQMVDGVISPKAGYGENGTSMATAATLFEKSGGDFASAGSNIQYTSGNWNNMVAELLVDSSDITGSIDFTPAIGTIADVLDGTYSTALRGGTADHHFEMEFPAPKDLTKVEYSLPGSYASYTGQVYVEYYNGSTWEEAHHNASYDFINFTSPDSKVMYVASFSSFGSHSRWRVRWTGNLNGSGIWQIKAHEAAPATSDNTVTADMGLTEAINISPASIIVKDGAGSALADSDVNVSYDLDGGGFTALESLDVFKARSEFISVNSLSLKLQPVGLAAFDLVDISSPSTEVLTLKDGIQYNKNGVLKLQIDDGITYEDATKQTTAFLGGATGSFTAQSGETVTVTNGVITSIV